MNAKGNWVFIPTLPRRSWKTTIHAFFELTYASYLVLPRSVLQSLPAELQKQLVNALVAIEVHINPAVVPSFGTYSVNLHNKRGRYIKDP